MSADTNKVTDLMRLLSEADNFDGEDRTEMLDLIPRLAAALRASRKLEVTDELVESVIVAVIYSAEVPTGMRPSLLWASPIIRERVDLEVVVRVILTAALATGGQNPTKDGGR